LFALLVIAAVPASRASANVICDLTSAGSSCSITGGTGSTGLFFTDEQHPTGSGVIDSFLPGLVAFNIVGGALMLAVGTFANYKSTGVLRRLKATGISPTTFVVAHATSFFLLGTAQTAAILIAAKLLFSVRLDVLMLFVVLGLAYLVFLALGLAISGWIRDPQRANAVAQSVAFPMIVIGLLGAALPPEVAAFTKYLPVAALTDAMQ